VVAIPEGTIYWWYNHGDEPLRVLFAADTTISASSPGRYRAHVSRATIGTRDPILLLLLNHMMVLDLEFVIERWCWWCDLVMVMMMAAVDRSTTGGICI
jgi:hypothetical protein